MGGAPMGGAPLLFPMGNGPPAMPPMGVMPMGVMPMGAVPPPLCTPLPSQPPPGLQEVVLDGCQAGVGLGLDDNNRVTILKPNGRAAASGLLGLGDRIVTVDGQVLG